MTERKKNNCLAKIDVFGRSHITIYVILFLLLPTSYCLITTLLQVGIEFNHKSKHMYLFYLVLIHSEQPTTKYTSLS